MPGTARFEIPLAPLTNGARIPEVPAAAMSAGARTVRQIRAGEDVLVLGAGPAGLTAAYSLARQGYPVTVLEADEQVGGLARTARYKEFRFDIGGHRFFTKLPAVQAFWDELLGDELLDVPRLSRIYYNGKFFNYPLRLTNALAGLGVQTACRIVASYLGARARPMPVEESFEQWVSNRFGGELYRIFFKTYTEKVWGIPCTEIRAEWAAQRIQGLSLARALISAMPLQRRSAEVRTLINEFKYPRLGPGQLWERCQDRVLALGGRLHLGHRVTRLEFGGCTAVVRADTPNGEARFEAEHVISTISLRSLVQALGDAPPSGVREAAEGLTYRDFVLVALVLDRNDLFPDNWIYVHTPGVQVGRIQNFNNWSRALVPDPSKTVLGMEYFCFQTDELWRRRDAELLELASRELAQLGLAPKARVLDGTVVRVTGAYPIYNAAYRKYLSTIRPYLDGIPNLHTIGRNGMHKYNNQDHSMYAAMLTVENMRGAAHDVWAVNTDYEYHEELRLNGQPRSGACPVTTAEGGRRVETTRTTDRGLSAQAPSY